MKIIITVFEKSGSDYKILGGKQIVIDNEEVYINKEGIINEFKLNSCKVKVSITKRPEVIDYKYYVEVILYQILNNHLYGSLYRLGEDILIDCIFDIIKRNVLVNEESNENLY